MSNIMPVLGGKTDVQEGAVPEFTGKQLLLVTR